MADNVTLNAGTGGDTVAADDIGGVKYPRSKLVHGADGTNAGDVADSNPLPIVPGASASVQGLLTFHIDALTATDLQIKASSGRLYGFHAWNPNDVTVFLHFWNAADPVVGTDTPFRTYAVKPGDSLDKSWPIGVEFLTAMAAAATANKDGSGGSPGVGLLMTGEYR